jgi:hypothetical protein
MVIVSKTRTFVTGRELGTHVGWDASLVDVFCRTIICEYAMPRPVRAREGHMTRAHEKLVVYGGVFRIHALL